MPKSFEPQINFPIHTCFYFLSKYKWEGKVVSLRINCMPEVPAFWLLCFERNYKYYLLKKVYMRVHCMATFTEFQLCNIRYKRNFPNIS